MWPAIISGGLLSIAGGIAGQNQLRNTMDNVKGHLSEWKDSIDDYKDLSSEFLNINSQRNQDIRQNIKENFLDFAGSANSQNARNLASGGLGGFSGIANQNTQNLYHKVMANAEDSFQSVFQQNQKFGGSLLDSFIKNLRAYGENIAQGQIQNDAMKASLITQGTMGMGQGLMEGGIGELVG